VKVSCRLGIACPAESITSATSVCVSVGFSDAEVSLAFCKCRLMLSTVHVVNVTGKLVVGPIVMPGKFPIDAKIVPWPGVTAVARPLAASIVTTAVCVLVHVNGPTCDVMSAPPLKALALNCRVPACDTHDVGGALTTTLSTCG